MNDEIRTPLSDGSARVESPEHQIDELLELLKNERLALLQGDFDFVSEQVELKKSLCDALENTVSNRDGRWTLGVTAKKLEKLKSEISRNASLLEGARNGIQLAQRRLVQIAKKAGEIGVYDPTGGRPQMTSDQSRGKCV